MKQVVKEIRRGQSVEISYSYDYCPLLKGKKEREEVVVGNTTYYWIRVANDPVKSDFQFPTKQQIKKAKAEKLKETIRELKRDRLETYRKYVEEREKESLEALSKGLEPEIVELQFSQKDRKAGEKLKQLTNKINKVLEISNA